jgi:hypothetical protein
MKRRRPFRLVLGRLAGRRRGVVTQASARIPMANSGAVLLRWVGQATRC